MADKPPPKVTLGPIRTKVDDNDTHEVQLEDSSSFVLHLEDGELSVPVEKQEKRVTCADVIRGFNEARLTMLGVLLAVALTVPSASKTYPA